MIKRLKVKNFKSFKEIDVNLGRFNVLIGPNASGKTNFTQIFNFIRDIINLGLEDAIFSQGGPNYIRNLNCKEDFLTINISLDEKLSLHRKGTPFGINIEETEYEIDISFRGKSQFIIDREIIFEHCEFIDTEKKEANKGFIKVLRERNDVKVEINSPENFPLKENDICSPLLPQIIGKYSLLRMISPPFADQFLKLNKIKVFNINPQEAKKNRPISGRLSLEEDGSNLPLILKNILEDDEKRNKLLNLVNDILPFVEDIIIEKRFEEKELSFKLYEKYLMEDIPSSLISDGTINLIIMIIMLYFEKLPLVIIEEPERNIHPSIIFRIVNMMKEASKDKQIIITTHNPLFVKYVDLENLLLIKRDEEGNSVITCAEEHEEIKIFLENEIGLDELFVKNILS